MCDFCGEQRAMVHCRSDAANLCLSCDRNVHSANALSRRHSRTLLCERCNTQPASVRCVDENVSLCQNCDWNGHSTSSAMTTHDRQTINCYSGCPSAEELSRIWSCVMDSSQDNTNSATAGEEDYGCEQKMGLMRIEENSVSDYSMRPDNNNNNHNHSSNNNSTIEPTATTGRSDEDNVHQYGLWRGSSSMRCSDNQFGDSLDSGRPKPSSNGFKSLVHGEDDFYNEFNATDGGDINFENYEELFSTDQDFENGGMDSLFAGKDFSAQDSGDHGGFFAEGSSTGKLKMVQSTCSDAASADSGMSAKTEPNFCYSSKPAHSNLSFSFSGLNGDCNVGDYQDSGVSPMLLMDEPPWFPPGAENAYPSASRDSAVLRYREKKKARKFEKKIRYESRKARADVRKRVKGRFVKAGEAYDYDPMSRTRSY